MATPSLAIRIQRLERQHDALRAQLATTSDQAGRDAIDETLQLVARAIATMRAQLLPRGANATAPGLTASRPYVREVRVRVAIPDRPRAPIAAAAIPAPVAAARPTIGHFSLAMAAYKPPRETELAYEVVWTPHRNAPSLIGDYDSGPRSW